MMGHRLGSALVAVLLLSVATAAFAKGGGEGTDPHVRPAYGQPSTAFTLTFTLRDAPGHEGVMATEYRVQVTPPAGHGSSCMAAQPPAITSGTAGALEQVKLMPESTSWCRGTYLVTVFLQRGPYCPPPVQGGQPTPCPEFATQQLNTGSTAFVVGRSGPLAPIVSVPRLTGLKPRIANRRVRRHHLRVHYTALGNLCAGLPPHGRIILQQPVAGTRVPRGSTVLVQTGCGTASAGRESTKMTTRSMRNTSNSR
jgi:PASTA domain